MTILPFDPMLDRSADLLFKRLREYLREYPPVVPSEEEQTVLPERQLRAYVYDGAVHVVVTPFAIWTLERHGFNEIAQAFGPALTYAGGRDGEVAASSPGKTVHVWRLPSEGIYAISPRNLIQGPLH